jgi:prevent-host-death family protein
VEARTWLHVAMKRVKIAELKNQLSKYLRAVERGETVEVTDRDRPIARIVPVPEAERLTIIPAKRPFSEIRDREYPPSRLPVPITDVLREERGNR